MFIAHEKKKTRVPVMDRNCKKIKNKRNLTDYCFKHNFQYLQTKIAEDSGPKNPNTCCIFFLFKSLIHKPFFFKLFPVILIAISFAISKALVNTVFLLDNSAANCDSFA